MIDLNTIEREATQLAEHNERAKEVNGSSLIPGFVSGLLDTLQPLALVARIRRLEAAMRMYIKRHEGHGPSPYDSADIHWSIYRDDIELFRIALACSCSRQWSDPNRACPNCGNYGHTVNG